MATTVGIPETGTIDYASDTAPQGYICSACGEDGLRLYRRSPYRPSQPELYCAECAAEAEGVSIVNMRPDGFRRKGWQMVDTIGQYVPAIPSNGEHRFCERGKESREAREWWVRRLVR